MEGEAGEIVVGKKKKRKQDGLLHILVNVICTYIKLQHENGETNV